MPNIYSTATYGGNLDPTGYAGDGGTGYSPIFGGIPANISNPNPFGDLSAAYPNLSGTNAQASQDIYSQLQGNLSPGTLSALKNAAASWGVGAGMPNGPMIGNKALANVAGFSENQINSGLQNYGRIIPTVSGTQTVNPNLQAEIASHNAAINAAPNPQQAQSYAQQLFNQYLQSLRGPGGGTTTSTSPAGSGALGAGFGTLGPTTTLGTTPDQAQAIYDLFQGTELGAPGDGTTTTNISSPDQSYLEDIGAF